MRFAVFLAMHLVGLVGYTILLRRSALAKADKYIVSALMTTAMYVPVVAFVVLGKVDFEIGFSNIGWLFIQSLFYLGLNILTVLALNHLEASTFTIIYSLRLLFVTILGAIFLGSHPPFLQIIGGMVILGSVFLLNLHKDKVYLSKPILYGLAATLWFSFNSVAEKHVVDMVGFPTLVFFATGMAMVWQWVIVALRRIPISKYKDEILHKETLLLMVFRPMSMWFFVAALSIGSVAVVNYVSGMGVVLVVLMGVFVLNEREHLVRKLLAAGVALLGLTLILIGKLI